MAPHRDGCWCVESSDNPMFVVHEQTRFDLAQNGRAGGHRMWHIFRCNDPDCPAQVAVRWDVITDLIGRVP